MGNRTSCAGGRHQQPGQPQQQGHGMDTPYSKQISANMIRFWAEVFLLAQDASQPSSSSSSAQAGGTPCRRHGRIQTKWQMVVPKLVPVNIVRVQDSPCTVTHVTAYNTKVDKVMDVMLSFPGVDLFRGSECFVYWCEPVKGLTWGLNFITPDDAAYFVDIVSGRSHSVQPRRAQSVVAQSRHSQQPQQQSDHQQQQQYTPGSASSDLLSGLHRRVQFADQRSGAGSEVDAALVALHDNKPLQLHLTGQKLHDWDAVLPPDPPDLPSGAPSEQPTVTDESIASSGKRTPCSANDLHSSTSTHISLPVSASGDSFIHVGQTAESLHAVGGPYDHSNVWQSTASSQPVTPAKRQPPPPPPRQQLSQQQQTELIETQSQATSPPMALTEQQQHNMTTSLDSSVLRRMLTPLPIQTTKTSTAAEIVLQQKGQIYTTKIEIPPRPRVHAADAVTPSRSAVAKPCSDVAMNASSSSISSTDAPATAGQQQQQHGSRHRVKRSSLHLLNNANGLTLTNQLGMQDSGSSLSSSQHSDASGTPTQTAHVKTMQTSVTSGQKTRKTGFMLLKRWLARSSESQQFAVCANEPWHQYWARLKGTQLHLFKVTPGNSDVSDANEPAHSFTNQQPTLVVDVCRGLVQPMPEYPRRSNVFCISTATGTAFLLQVTSEAELDAWASAVHTAAAYDATHCTNKDAAVRALKKQLEKIEQRIDSVTKMLSIQHMPSVSAVSAAQVAGWERELELLHTNHFVLRCYLAALKAQDEPSCKLAEFQRALGAACAESKRYLSQLGVFTMSAVHAYLLSRIDPVTLAGPHAITNAARHCSIKQQSDADAGATATQLQVHLATGQVSVIAVQPEDSVSMALNKACAKMGVLPRRHFLSFRRPDQKNEPIESGAVPDDDQNINGLMEPLALVDLCDRACYHIHLRTQHCPNEPLGLTVRTQRVQHDLIAYVANVDKGGPADRAGVSRGDELLAVNLRSVRSLPSPLHVEQLLQRSDTLCLVLRSKRHSLASNLNRMQFTTSTDSLHLSCEQGRRADQQSASGAAAAGQSGSGNGADLDDAWLNADEHVHRNKVKYRNLSSRISAVNRIKQRCSLPPSKRNSQMSNSSGEGCVAEEASSDQQQQQQSEPTEADGHSLSSTSSEGHSRHTNNSHRSSLQSNTSGGSQTKMTAAERLEKILYELVETEKAYIECLKRLMSQYLLPLKKSALFPESETDRLVSTTQAIIRFQTSFFDELQEAAGCDDAHSSSTAEASTPSDPSSPSNATPAHLRNALLRVGGVLLSASNNFKVYSPFCAVHFRVQKILRNAAEDKNESLVQFLASCNTASQLSCSIESYLIKPIQRVLRYPLFLQQIKALTTAGSPENLLISEALTKMEKVAEYINEMQRVYEEYGQLFAVVHAHFANELRKKKLSMELSELLMFGECDWLNATEPVGGKAMSRSISKSGRNGSHPPQQQAVESLCFVFKSFILVAPNQAAVNVQQLHAKNKKKSQSQAALLSSCRLIPIREVEVNGSDLGSTERQFLWILIHMNSSMTSERVYHFVNRRQDVKTQFLRAIRKAALITANRDAANQTSNATQTHQSALSSHTKQPTTAQNGAQAHMEPISSPDSGGPPHLGMPLLDRCSSEPTKPAVTEPQTTATDQQRPASHYSSQSDGGYASNTCEALTTANHS